MKANQMKLQSPMKGRIELYTKPNDKIVVDLSRVLPDGSRLTDTVNRHLLTTIEQTVAALYPRLAGQSLTSHLGALHLLVQWMFLRGIHRFRSLQRHHFMEFLEDSSKGLDFCISATSRMRSYLLQTNCSLSAGERANLKVLEAFEAAHIPPSYAPHLPNVVRLIKAFIERGRVALEKHSWEPSVAMLSRSTMQTRANAIESLWTFRDHIEDAITFDPTIADIQPELGRLCAKPAQTPVIPHRLAFKLLLGSIKVVMMVGPAFIAWREQRQKALAEHPELAFQKLRHAIAETTGCSLVNRAADGVQPYFVASNIQKTLIPVACQIIAFQYVGRRNMEVKHLESNCISGNTKEGRRLSSYLAKRQSYESRPCPEIVAKAVELMIQLHDYKTGDAKPLFRKVGKSTLMNVAMHLDSFAKLFDALTYVDSAGIERTWHFSPHQFRRLYAIYYIWRYEDGSYLSLRHHFGHASDAEAAFYARLASDANYVDLMDEAKLLTLERLRDVSTGGLLGSYASVLAKRIERVRANLRIASERNIEPVIAHLVEEEGVRLHASLWGYCGCRATTSNLRRANCRQGANADRPVHSIFNTPIPEDSSEEICGGCYFHCTSSLREPHWKQVALQLEKSIAGGRKKTMATQALRQRLLKIQVATDRLFPARSQDEQ